MAFTSLTVCLHTRYSSVSCGSGGGEAIATALEKELEARGSDLKVNRLYCFGMCDHGPNVRLTPGGRFFHHVDPNNLDEILTEVDSLDDQIG